MWNILEIRKVKFMGILAFEWSLFCRFHGFHKINKSNTLYFCCLRNSMHHVHLPGLSGKIEIVVLTSNSSMARLQKLNPVQI